MEPSKSRRLWMGVCSVILLALCACESPKTRITNAPATFTPRAVAAATATRVPTRTAAPVTPIAMPRPTATPRPTAKAADVSVGRVTAGDVLFEERFDNNNKDWFDSQSTNQYATCQGSVADGSYVVSTTVHQEYSTCYVIVPDFTTVDGAFSARMTIISTTAKPGEVNLSLVMRTGDDAKYAFYFFNDGGYSARLWQGADLTELQEKDYSKYVNLQAGVTNEFSVTASGPSFTAYANGHLLYTVMNNTLSRSGGLWLQTSADRVGQSVFVEYDDIVVSEPASVQVAEVSPTPKPISTTRPVATKTKPATTSVPIATKVAAADQYTLIFHFGAQGCPYSRRTAPAVESFYNKYTDRVKVIGMMVPGWGNDVADFRSATGITFPVVNTAGSAVNTKRIPVIVLTNQGTGQSTVISVGVIAYSQLVSQVEAVMAGRTIVASSGSS